MHIYKQSLTSSLHFALQEFSWICSGIEARSARISDFESSEGLQMAFKTSPLICSPFMRNENRWTFKNARTHAFRHMQLNSSCMHRGMECSCQDVRSLVHQQRSPAGFPMAPSMAQTLSSTLGKSSKPCTSDTTYSAALSMWGRRQPLKQSWTPVKVHILDNQKNVIR